MWCILLYSLHSGHERIVSPISPASKQPALVGLMVSMMIWCCKRPTLRLGMMLWWCYDGVMMMLWWCYDDVMMMLWRCYGHVMMMLWWCYDDVMVMFWWCYDDVMMMLWWCYDDVMMMLLWWCYDDVMMMLWCHYIPPYPSPGMSQWPEWLYLTDNTSGVFFWRSLSDHSITD